MTAQGALDLLSLLEIPFLGLLAFRLWQTGLFRIYRALFVFSLFEALRAGIASGISPYTRLYSVLFVVTEPVTWVLFALMTLETYQTALAGFPAISSVSRRFISVSLALAVFLAVISLVLGTSTHEGDPVLEAFFVVGRVVNVSLLFFVVCLALVLFWFPVPLTRNALVNAAAFTFYFATTAAAMFGRNLVGPEFRVYASLAIIGASLAVVCLWSILLTANDEKRSAGIPRDKEAAERLVGQLEALNSTLAGTFKK